MRDSPLLVQREAIALFPLARCLLLRFLLGLRFEVHLVAVEIWREEVDWVERCNRVSGITTVIVISRGAGPS